MNYPGRISKRVRLNSSGDAQGHTTWQRCHSGFEDDMIEDEHLKASATRSSGTRGKKVTKGRSRKPIEQSLVPDTEIEIDWESSSSDDSDLQTGTATERPRQNASTRKTSEWLSPIMKPDHLLALRVKGVREDEETVAIDDAEKLPDKVDAVDKTEADETRISDYESSDECETPSGHVSVQGLPSSAITPTQSPSISSYGQSTQESTTAGVSPLTSSQWVSMFKGQQTTPTKASMPGTSHTEEAEGKDSAKKKMKFTSRGLAERLQKLINREKSDVAFWQHQPLSQQGSQTGVCCIKINSLAASRGLFVAHCSNLEDMLDVAQCSQGRLPEKLVVLFSHKTVEDKHIQVGSSVAIHPPWQKLILPETSQTVLLCTYFCQVIDSGDSDRPPSSADSARSSEQVLSTPRRVFRPNRLFSENSTNPELCLNQSILAQSQLDVDQTAESLLDILSTKGPSFDFEFNLRALVLRVYEMVSNSRTMQSTEEQTWRVLARDKDCTIFEVHLTCDVNQVPESLQGKFVDFKQLKVIQRINKMKSPGLFSMIDSFSKSFTSKTKKAAGEPGNSEVAVSMQSISFLLLGSKFDVVSKDTHQDTLSLCSLHPTKLVNLSEIQKQEPSQRVSFHAMLLHSTSMEALNPTAVASSRQASGLSLLFVTDPSLLSIARHESRHTRDHSNYICIEKLSSCAIKWTEADFEKSHGSVLYFEDVFVKGDTSLVLDCYSTVSMDPVRESSPAGNPAQLENTHLKSFELCLSISYPDLSDESSENTLVSVSGIMEGVDEDTAYSWPVCNVCESNQLGGDNSENKLYCPFCAKEVTTPLTRIHLEIFVRCSNLKPKCTAKVKLKQQTIKDLFGEPSASEPFDLKKILEKPLPPTSCFIRKISEQDKDLRVIHLEEI